MQNVVVALVTFGVGLLLGYIWGATKTYWTFQNVLRGRCPCYDQQFDHAPRVS